MPEPPQSHLDLPDDDGTIEPTAQAAPSQKTKPVERLSESVVNVIERAERLARERGHDFVTSDDLFAALVTEPRSAVSEVLESLGFSGAELVHDLAFILGRNNKTALPLEVGQSPRVVEMLTF